MAADVIFTATGAGGASEEATVTTGTTNTDIVSASQNPKRVRTDEGSVEERSIKEMIDADRYDAASSVTGVPWGLKMARVKPGGSISGA